MRDRINLLRDRVINSRVRVANADGQDAAKTIEILVTFVVPDMKALAFNQRQRLLVISRDCGEKKFFVFANSFGLASCWLGCAHVFITSNGGSIKTDFARPGTECPTAA